MLAKAIEVQGVWYLISEKFTEPAVGKSYYDGVSAIRIFGTGNCYDLRAVNIIAQSKTNDEGIPLFTPSWVEDVEALAKSIIPLYEEFAEVNVNNRIERRGFKKGYNLAKEKYKYTEEDMSDAIGFGCERKYRTYQIMEMVNQPPTYTVTYEIIDGIINILNAEKR